jgi:hypothetical protein
MVAVYKLNLYYVCNSRNEAMFKYLSSQHSFLGYCPWSL